MFEFRWKTGKNNIPHQPNHIFLQKSAHLKLVRPHVAGFFSCCSVLLDALVKFVHQYRMLPSEIETTTLFTWYAVPFGSKGSMLPFFSPEQEHILVPSNRLPVFVHDHQFSNFTTLDYQGLTPLVRRYFAPNNLVQHHLQFLETKHEIDYTNTCVLFYRGNDKCTETLLSTHESYLPIAQKVLAANPKVRFLVQSDEQEFVDFMMEQFPERCFCFSEQETRRISKCVGTVDLLLDKNKNQYFAQWYLAITYVMSKCAFVVCGSGNCSVWIALFRGHAHGMTQFLNGQWMECV